MEQPPVAAIEPIRQRQIRLHSMLERFQTLNPQPTSELHYTNPYQLLVAVLMSAQAQDKVVNQITKDLFKQITTPADLLKFSETELAAKIRLVGLAPTKAKHLRQTAQILVDRHQGLVPSSRRELENLPGIGGKSAGVILNLAFQQPTLPVDTHVLRVSHRLGLTKETKPEKIEAALLQMIKPEYKLLAHHWLILHGRYTCSARAPKCPECPIADLCPSFGYFTLIPAPPSRSKMRSQLLTKTENSKNG